MNKPRSEPTASLLQVDSFTKWANIFRNAPFQQRFDIVLALFWLHNDLTLYTSVTFWLKKAGKQHCMEELKTIWH